MRLIHVKTFEQYNAWMQKLDDEGYVWNGGVTPIDMDEIDDPNANFVVELEIDDGSLSYGYRGYYTKNHPDTEIEDHKENDMVNHPPHYNQGGIEVIDIIQASMTPEMFRGYLLGNVLKYMLRAPYKGNADQDHEKAKWYYDKLRSVDDENNI